MTKNNTINECIKKRILELYEKGLSNSKIASNLQICRKSVDWYLNRIGLSSNYYKFSEQQEKQIQEMYISGVSAGKISKCVKKNINMVLKWLKNKGLFSKDRQYDIRKYSCNDSFFEKIDTQEKAYWIGFIAADGYIRGKKYKSLQIEISETDVELLRLFAKDIRASYPIRTRKRKTAMGNIQNLVSIGLQSKQIVHDLSLFTIVQNKTYTLDWDIIVNKIPKNLIHHFVRGYFDGDGCVSTDGKNRQKRANYSFVCASYKFATGLKKYIEDSCKLKSVKLRDKKTYYVVSWGGNNICKKIYNFLYNDSSVCLERKRSRAEEIMSIPPPGTYSSH